MPKTPIKVTDLEEFAEFEIWRPMFPAHPEYGNHVKTGMPETYREWLKRNNRRRFSLSETVEELQKHKGTYWEKRTMDRIAAVKFRFPAYIVHPLVDIVKERVAEIQQNKDS